MALIDDDAAPRPFFPFFWWPVFSFGGLALFYVYIVSRMLPINNRPISLSIYLYIPRPLFIHVHIRTPPAVPPLQLRLPGGLVVDGPDLERVLVLILRVQPRGGHLARGAVPPQRPARHRDNDRAAHLEEKVVVDVAHDAVGRDLPRRGDLLRGGRADEVEDEGAPAGLDLLQLRVCTDVVKGMRVSRLHQ